MANSISRRQADTGDWLPMSLVADAYREGLSPESICYVTLLCP